MILKQVPDEHTLYPNLQHNLIIACIIQREWGKDRSLQASCCYNLQSWVASDGLDLSKITENGEDQNQNNNKNDDKRIKKKGRKCGLDSKFRKWETFAELEKLRENRILLWLEKWWWWDWDQDWNWIAFAKWTIFKSSSDWRERIWLIDCWDCVVWWFGWVNCANPRHLAYDMLYASGLCGRYDVLFLLFLSVRLLLLLVPLLLLVASFFFLSSRWNYLLLVKRRYSWI